jgi:signal transduction histidine kinase
VRLRVEDDGLGAGDPSGGSGAGSGGSGAGSGGSGAGSGGSGAGSGGFGLQGMRERAELAGGTLVITTGPDRGFALELEVPG